MVDARVIEPAQLEWALPVLFVPNPGGSMGFFIYYRRLNVVTINDTYLLQLVGVLLDLPGDTKIFSAVDAI